MTDEHRRDGNAQPPLSSVSDIALVRWCQFVDGPVVDGPVVDRPVGDGPVGDGQGVEAELTPRLAETQVNEIFFSTSNRRSFASNQERACFRNLWLGQYLETYPELALLAVDRRAGKGPPKVVGYAVGWLQSPLADPRFSSLGYFPALADSLARYPAHLHINLHAHYRSAGLGSLLICTLCSDIAAKQIPGIHVVTGHGARNTAFYQRNGFEPVASVKWGASKLVQLGRVLNE
ncbi:MAG: hypothetical protein AAFR70_13475 [Pseudomonadota bacterium]